MYRKQLLSVVAVAAFALTFNPASHAEVSAGSKTARPLITQKIDETKLVTLAGNTRPEAKRSKYDHGAVPLSTPMPTMQLLLKRSPEQEAALVKLIDQLHTPGNPLYHQWLTAEEFRKSFGVSQADVAKVEEWLTSKGFQITGATGTGLQIEFEGTVGAVNAAFHTEIHNVADKNGDVYFANIKDPQIPEALTPAVVGPISLNNFPAKNHIAKKTAVSFDPKTREMVKAPEQPTGEPKVGAGGNPDYTGSGTYAGYYILGAGDLQTIYNLGPLYSAGYTGKGMTIGFLEDTPIYSTSDFSNYQSAFGLTSYGGTFANNNPAKPASGGVTCSAPRDNGDDIEAELDVEMGIALAPGATIVNENCKAGTTVFGGLAAFENLENSTTFPAVISMSYGICEAAGGTTYNAAFNTAFQQGAAEGISIFVSAGDNASGSCDQAEQNDTDSAYGLGVTGWGETPYNVAVGGTDFGDSYAGTNSTYWSATNSSTYESALSYVPEIPWNNSCASSLIAQVVEGASYTTPLAFCNTSTASSDDLLSDVGGGGGYSSCATGAASTTAVTSGTCKGYAQPSWQTGLLGVPTTYPAIGKLSAGTTAVRTVPDVSLFAANGVWSHFIVICYSHTADGGTACTGAPQGWTGLGGTSASAPMMASIQALVDQYVQGTTNGTGAYQGNPNYVYYNLAKTEYGSSGNSACSSTLGNAVASSCVFYDITQGDNDSDCQGSYNCYIPSGDTYGISSTASASSSPSFVTGTGYDLATGIGSVNAYNLATNWRNAFPTTTALTLGSATDSGNGNDKLTATVSAATKDNGLSGGTQIPIAGTATFYDGSSSLGTCTVAAGTCSLTITGSQLNPGSNSITVAYSGSNAYPASTSSSSTITETDATTTAVSALPTSITTAQTTVFTATVTNTTLASSAPTGTVTFTLGSTSGTQVGSCTLTAGTSSSTCSSAAVSGATLGVGSDTVYANYAGVTNNYASSSGSTGVTVSAVASNVITFSSTTHNFGTVAVGTAATAYTLQVKNTGTTAYPFVLNFTPANGFTSATNCPASIAAGGTCEIAFYFTPTATGTVTDTWSLTAENGFTYSPSNGGTLTGGGTSQGGVSLSTAGHNWGTVAVGTTSAAYGVTLSNSTSSAVTLTLGSVTSPFASQTNCGATLAAGASCQFSFTFTPTSTATVSQTYSVSAGGVTITSGGNTVTGIVLSGN